MLLSQVPRSIGQSQDRLLICDDEGMLVKEQSRLLSLIESGFAALRVLVIGDVMLDRSIWGEVDRISPEAPVPVLRSVRTTSAPGGAANVAMKAVGLGSRVRLVGLVGDDEPAAALRGLLADGRQVADGLVADPSRATTVKTRFIAHNQQLLRVDRENRDAPVGAIRDRLAEAAYAAAADTEVAPAMASTAAVPAATRRRGRQRSLRRTGRGAASGVPPRVPTSASRSLLLARALQSGVLRGMCPPRPASKWPACAGAAHVPR